jgi:adhesin transport system membrane fusion protein
LNEIQEQKILFKTAGKSLELIRREIATIEPLVKSGLAPETRLIALLRDEEVTIGNANSAESVQLRLMSGLEEIEDQLTAENQNYLTSALTDLSSIGQEISELEARIPALEEQVERTSVVSPVNGVINQITYSTVGAYVRSGDVLLEIVPTGSDLKVKAKIDPKDIADVVVGQDVKISLTAYNPSKFGRIDGNVIKVSADALTDQGSGAQYYDVDVSINGTLYEKDGSEVIILPGMVASLDVLSGKRTILDYFWQPIASTKDRALRD